MIYQNKYQVANYLADPFINRSIKGPTRPEVALTKNLPNYQNVTYTNAYAFLGHSSIFVKLSDDNILIDPVFSKCVGPFNLFGSKRYPGPKITNACFPKLKLILITHNHYDHLDFQTLKALDKQTEKYVVPLGVKQELIRHHFNVNKIIELNWFENIKLDKLDITCLPSHHNSMRSGFDRNKSLWCSYLIKNQEHSIYHSGDSAFSEHFNDIKKQIIKPDIVFMECGQYNEHWHQMHMFPEESIRACQILAGKLNIPIHWGAYCLSLHSWNEPIIRFKQRAEEVNLPFLIPEIYQLNPF